MQIGMIGLGRMGANMARRLIRKGHTCVVFNRSPQAVIRIFQDLPATSPTLVKDAGPLRLRSMKQYRPQFSRRRFMSDSVLGARRTLPTSSCPRCGTNSVDIWISQTANPKSLGATSKKVLAPGIGPDKRATNYAATSLVGKDKHELADLSTNHRSVPSRFGFAIVFYCTEVDRRHGEGRNTCGGGYREPRP